MHNGHSIINVTSKYLEKKKYTKIVSWMISEAKCKTSINQKHFKKNVLKNTQA